MYYWRKKHAGSYRDPHTGVVFSDPTPMWHIADGEMPPPEAPQYLHYRAICGYDHNTVRTTKPYMRAEIKTKSRICKRCTRVLRKREREQRRPDSH